MPHNTFAASGRDLIGHRIDNGRLEFISVLGLGAYGVVYLALDLQAPSPVYLAVKCLLRAGLDSRQRHFQRREIALHQLASRHRNVVTLHKVLEEGEYVYVIMDYCDNGDLFGMITEKQRYIGRDDLIRTVFLQIVDAVEYCHSMGIFHRDLKPENILCTRDGSRICLADFGLATSERSSTDFGCGSTFYLSPECQGGLFERIEKYDTSKNDVWSLGVILVNLTCGRNPWRQACGTDETFRAFVHNADFLRTILPISHATNRILQGLFALEPCDRPSLRELRRQVRDVDTFTMTEAELLTAHSAAQAAAAAVRQPRAPATPQFAEPERMLSASDVEMFEPAQAHPAWSADANTPRFEHSFESLADAGVDGDGRQRIGHENDAGAVTAQNTFGQEHHVQSVQRWHNERPQYNEEFPALAPVQFQPHRVQAHIRIPPAPVASLVPAPVQTPMLVSDRPHQRGPLTQAQAEARARPSDGGRMEPSSSQSSSSGGNSLPPTPEFDPADKTQDAAHPAVPDWDLGGSDVVQAKITATPTDGVRISAVPRGSD